MLIEHYAHLNALGEAAEGIESPWLDFCSIELASGRLLLSDPIFYPEGTVVVELGPGTYRVQVRLIDEEGQRRASRLRVTSDTAALPGSVLGTVEIDSALLGVGDAERLAQRDELAQKEIALVWDRQDAEAGYGIVPWVRQDGTAMPFVESILGYGDYPVYELRRGEHRVGAQVDFVDHS
jgi:hypothetical protein